MTVRVAAYWARADLPGKGHVPYFLLLSHAVIFRFDHRNMKQGSAMNRFAALLAVCALTLAGCTTSAADPE